MKAKEFKFSFQLSKLDILNVCYYKLGGNKSAYFTISAAVLQRGKQDYEMCGQCQEEVSKRHGAARRFVNKFTQLHLSDLTEEQYRDVVAGIEDLKNKYNWIESGSFNQIVSMSKLTPKKI